MTLDNGLQVWLVPRPGFPKVAFVLAVRGGYTADPKERPGIADLISNVVSQGTKTRSAKQVAEELQAAGGDLGTEAGPDALLLSTSVLSGKDGAALRILADVVPECRIRRYRGRDRAPQCGGQSRGERGRTGFSRHPGPLPGVVRRQPVRHYLADQGVDREIHRGRDAAGVWPALPAGSGAAGGGRRFRRGGADRRHPRQFLALEDRGPGFDCGAGEPKTSVNRAVVYVPRSDSVQTTLYMGALGPTRADSDYQAARLANAIYGGMFGSRLVANIREDKGYTYSPGSRLAPFEKVGVLRTRADVRNEVTGASYNEISYELNRMASTEPEAVELESAKRYLIGTIAIQLQSQAAVARSLAGLWVDHLPPEELERQGQAIEKVSAKEIEGVGKKYYPAWRMTVVAVGDEQVIKDQLSPFGFEFQKSE